MSLKTQAKVLRVRGAVMEPFGERRDSRRRPWLGRENRICRRTGRPFRETLLPLEVVPIFGRAAGADRDVAPWRSLMAMLAREYGRRPKTFDAYAGCPER